MLSSNEPPLTGLARLGYIVPTPPSPRDGERATMARVLDQVCPVPNPYDSAGAFERYHHGDLSAMNLADLRRERRRVRCRLDLDERPSAWLRERLEAVRQTLAMHKASRRAPPTPSRSEADAPLPYHKPLPGLRRTVRGLRHTLRSGL